MIIIMIILMIILVIYMANAGRNRFGSIRFGSGFLFFENSPVRFGSVRTASFPGSMRFGLSFSDASWLGPVRFGSVPRLVLNGSVRFGSAGSVRFLAPSCYTYDNSCNRCLIMTNGNDPPLLISRSPRPHYYYYYYKY